MGKSEKTMGQMASDTKNTRKFNSAWGVIYLPKTLVERLGGPELVEFTVEAKDGGE